MLDHRILLAATAGVAALCVAAPATAQPVQRYDQPAQPLASALRAFARAGGAQIAIDEEAVAGRRAPALRGTFTAQAALDRLLRGSGLTARRGASGIFIVGGRPDAEPAAEVAIVRDEPSPEIVVTARKREERAVDVPIAVAAERGEAMEARGADGIADALQEAPGVGVYDQGNGVAKITIRGVSTSLGANDNGYYLDDLPFTGVTVPITPDVRMWDLDRVEVLRGPQGTLFGEGSLGGTVRILTRGADLDRWEAKGAATLSTTADGGTNRGVKAAVNLPILPGKLAVRVAGTAEHFPGWIDDAATGEKNLNDQSYATLRARLRFDPTDRLSITGSYWYYKGRFPGGGSGATDDGERTRFLVLAARESYRLYGATARYDFGGAEFFYSYTHNQFELPQRGQFLGGAFIGDVAIKVDAQELRLASTSAGPLQWTIGAYARDARRRDKLEVGNFAVDNVDATNSRARALFGEATYSLPAAPVDLTAGLRYFRERLTGFEINSGVSIPDPGATYESWNPRFSIAWHPIANSTLYVSAAKGFRSGQLQPLVAVQLGRIFGLDLPPSVGQDWIWTYEIGGKADLLGDRLSVEAALYHSDWRNVPIRIPIGGTAFNGLINSKGTRTNGVELGAVWRPAAGFRLKAGGSYIDAAYSASVPDTGIVAGAPVDDIAGFTAFASADYRRPLSDRVDGFARLGWQHSSPRFLESFPNYLPGDRIDRVDLRLGIEIGHWSIAGFVDNLTDDRGATNYRVVQPLASGGLDITANRLRPRTIGVDAAVRF